MLSLNEQQNLLEKDASYLKIVLNSKRQKKNTEKREKKKKKEKDKQQQKVSFYFYFLYRKIYLFVRKHSLKNLVYIFAFVL